MKITILIGVKLTTFINDMLIKFKGHFKHCGCQTPALRIGAHLWLLY